MQQGDAGPTGRRRRPGRVTMDDVAAAAGVSRMTVSNAYNRPDQLSEATRARVLAAADRLGYAGPDPVGRSLRSGRAGTVGVLLADPLPYAFTDPGIIALLRGIAEGLSEGGSAMLLVPVEAGDDGGVVRSAMVDAFIVLSMGESHPWVQAARARRVPLVTLGAPRLRGVPQVGIDNAGAAALAGEHLQGLGHRRAVAVGLPWSEEPLGGHGERVGFRHRLEGFEVAMGADRTERVTAAANTPEAAAEALAPLLARPRRTRPTAVFGITDVLAIGALEAARSAGLEVPRDVSVVGFDDVEAAALAAPPLTTVRQPLAGQGRAAAGIALALVAGERPRVPRFHAELVVRGSTGPAPA